MRCPDQWCRCKKSSSGMRCLSRSRSSPMAPIVLPGSNYEPSAPVPRQGWWVQEKIPCPQRRNGQKTCRNGNSVGQDKRKEPHSSCSPPANHWLTACMAGHRKEKGGNEESRLRNQRRRIEGSGMRSGSLIDGAARSQESCSTKYRRSASLRAIRL